MRRVEEGEDGRVGGERGRFERRVGWRSGVEVLEEMVVMDGVSSPRVIEDVSAGWGFLK